MQTAESSTMQTARSGTMTIGDLFERAGDIKGELVGYGLRPRYDRARDEVLADFGVPAGMVLGDTGRVDEEEGRLIRALDYFVLEHRLRNGRTVVEQFVAARPDLPDQEREMLLGWRDVVHSVFEVQRHDDGALEALSLVDELTYHIRSNMGASVLRMLQPGWFLLASVVPVGKEWMISGTLRPQPPAEQEWANELALTIATRNPEAVYRNPEKLAKAWELQRLDRDRFIRFFGSDMLIVPGSELQQRMDAYWEFARVEPSGERSTVTHDRVMTFPDELTSAETVGMVYDDVDGLSYLAEMGLVAAAFDDPDLARAGRHRARLLDYLDDDTVDPSLLRRLAGRDHARASRLFRLLLDEPAFEWEQDGEALLRRRKSAYFAREPRPLITPVSERLSARATRTASDAIPVQ